MAIQAKLVARPHLKAIVRGTSGGGIDTSDATATSGDIAKDKTAYVNGAMVTGSVPVNESGTTFFYFGDSSLDFGGNSVEMKHEFDRNELFRVGSSIRLQSDSSNFGDATEADVVSGKTFTAKGGVKLTGTHECPAVLDTSDATASEEDISTGKTAYVNGAKITGTHECHPGLDTSDATASGADILKDKTAYVNGEKVTGTLSYIPSGTTTAQSYMTDSSDNVSVITVQSSKFLQITSGSITEPKAFLNGSKVGCGTKLSNLGDAVASDVAQGKTFTSASGLKVTGTHVCSSGIDTSDATATETDIARGVTAYVNGKKITGTVETREDGTGLNFNDEDVTILDRSSSGLVCLYAVPGKNYLIRPSVEVALYAELGRFGDATAADVAAGKTFTSAAGVLVTGTATSGSSGGIQAQHITSASDTITISGTGTVKVWGYGFYSSGTYNKTTYAFVGDGYYTASSYNTPTKTDATFGINGDGTLSGLPDGITDLDLLVTIWI